MVSSGHASADQRLGSGDQAGGDLELRLVPDFEQMLVQSPTQSHVRADWSDVLRRQGRLTDRAPLEQLVGRLDEIGHVLATEWFQDGHAHSEAPSLSQEHDVHDHVGAHGTDDRYDAPERGRDA